MDQMKKIGILGSGAMGTGIAQVFAVAGCEVILYDHCTSALERAQDALVSSLEKLVDKGKMTADAAKHCVQRVTFDQGLQSFHDRDLIVEAVTENLALKQQLFKDIELLVSSNCVLASNTSSLSITSIASVCSKPERVVGIHFFNPAPIMSLVEIIPALQTKPGLAEELRGFMSSLGKQPVIAKDTPGFIVNRVARPYYGEALRIKEEGIADEMSIDASMVHLGGFRMGPFELMDFIGNDVNYQVTLSVFEAFYYDARYKPAILQKRLVEAGFLGRKAGRGYYAYNAAGQKELSQPLSSGIIVSGEAQPNQEVFERILCMLINEAAEALHLGIASRDDLDMAITKGVNYPKGLLSWADELGIHKVRDRMDSLYELYREDRYRLSPLLRRMADKGAKFYD